MRAATRGRAALRDGGRAAEPDPAAPVCALPAQGPVCCAVACGRWQQPARKVAAKAPPALPQTPPERAKSDASLSPRSAPVLQLLSRSLHLHVGHRPALPPPAVRRQQLTPSRRAALSPGASTSGYDRRAPLVRAHNDCQTAALLQRLAWSCPPTIRLPVAQFFSTFGPTRGLSAATLASWRARLHLSSFCGQSSHPCGHLEAV